MYSFPCHSMFPQRCTVFGRRACQELIWLVILKWLKLRKDFCWHLREGYFFISPGYGVNQRDSGKSLGKSEIQTWEASSLEEILKLNSAYVIMSLASKVRPWEKLSSLEDGTNFEDHWETFKEPDLVWDLPSIHQVLLPASTQKKCWKKKKKRWKEDAAKILKVKKTWYKANLLLQDFTTESGDECGSKIRTSEWEQGHQSRIKSIAERQKAQRGLLLETSRKVKTRERKLFWLRNTITIISCEQ